MKKKLYFVNGIIFQKGVPPVIYNGIIEPKKDQPESLYGNMIDRWGESKITKFQLNETELKFSKQYHGRPIIDYHFTKKEENIWVGGYSGIDCGEGESKCVVTCIDESFFENKKEEEEQSIH